MARASYLIWKLCCLGVIGELAVVHNVAIAEPVGQWQMLNSRYPVLSDASDPAIKMTLRSDFTLNTSSPMLTIDVNQHPLPMCKADIDTGIAPVLLGDGTLNGKTQSFGYRCMGGQMTIVAWPIQEPAFYWKTLIASQQPISLTVEGVTFQSANSNGRSAIGIADRIFGE